jgi:hypothetical protein
VASDDRLELKLGAGYVDRAVAYFYGPNQAFVMETTGTDVMFGGASSVQVPSQAPSSP